MGLGKFLQHHSSHSCSSISLANKSQDIATFQSIVQFMYIYLVSIDLDNSTLVHGDLVVVFMLIAIDRSISTDFNVGP